MTKKICEYILCTNGRDLPQSMFCKLCRTVDVLSDGDIEQRHCGYCRKLHTLNHFSGKLRVCILKQTQRLEHAKNKRRKVSPEDEIILIDVKNTWD
jgi:hypothetical protein